MKTLLLPVFLMFVTLGGYSQALTSISPDNASQGDYLSVSISGQNTSFGQGTNTTVTWFSQGSSTIIYPDFVTVNSATSLNAQYSLSQTVPVGYYDVNVYNSSNGQLMMPNGFLIHPDSTQPYISSITPDSADLGDVLSVTISGQNTHFGQGTGTTSAWFQISYHTIYPDYVNVIDSQTINAQFTIGTNWYYAGYHDVKVYNPIDQTLVYPYGFNVTPGAFSSLNEKEAVNGIFKVFPVPFTDQLTVVFENISEPVTTIYLADVSGKTVCSLNPGLKSGQYTADLRGQELASGVYFVVARSGEKTYIQKVVR